MVYFISSSTKWPAVKENSIFFRNDLEENKFGNLNLLGESLIASIDMNLNALFFNKLLSSKHFFYGNIGQSIDNDIIFSLISLTKDTDYSQEYKERAFNIFEFLDKNDDDFWGIFEALLQLSFRELKKTGKRIDTFFMNLTFFPARVTADLNSFYTTLFSILNKYSTETFVIIVDPKSKQLLKLSYFKGLLENNEKYFESEIIICIPRDSNGELLKNCNYEHSYYVQWTQDTINDLERFIQRKFNKKNITEILIEFNSITQGNYKWDTHYASYKARLFDKYSLNLSDNKLPPYNSVENFFNKYLSEHIEKKNLNINNYRNRFFKLFQRFPIEARVPIDPKDFNQNWTYYKLIQEVSKWKYEYLNEDKVKNLCRKDKKINDADLKILIYLASLSAKISKDDAYEILKKYSFEISDYSLVDIVFSFIMTDLSDDIFVDDNVNPKYLEKILEITKKYELKENWKASEEWKYKKDLRSHGVDSLISTWSPIF